MSSKSFNRRYWLFSLIMIAIICVFVAVFYLTTAREVASIYEKNTQATIEQLKKSFLKETVDNQIRRIEQRRIDYIGRHKQLVERFYYQLKSFPADSFESLVDYFLTITKQSLDVGQIVYAVWDLDTDMPLYDPFNLIQTPTSGENSVSFRTQNLAQFRSIEFDNHGLAFAVPMSYIDASVKKDTANEIHSSVFEEDSYIWVNEVVDYQGGDDYAIRRIHPNLRETEGMLLSTSMTDIVGNHPYLEELEGVTEHGELFFTYYFKRKNSDEISKKLTYAKLFKPYDWIIAMGIHLDDMQSYIDTVNTQSTNLAASSVSIFVLGLVLLVVIGYGLIIGIEKWVARKERKHLEEEIYRDQLTDAWSRRAGFRDLAKAFDTFREKGVTSILMMIDIDNFKHINDRFGHDAGDRVLKEIAEQFYTALGNLGRLYRWGGDEFFIMCPGMQEKQGSLLAEQMRHQIEQKKITSVSEELSLTITAGISLFEHGDEEFSDAVKRSDIALYRAKQAGKNQIAVEKRPT